LVGFGLLVVVAGFGAAVGLAAVAELAAADGGAGLAELAAADGGAGLAELAAAEGGAAAAFLACLTSRDFPGPVGDDDADPLGDAPSVAAPGRPAPNLVP
jgi:hypothetical protein